MLQVSIETKHYNEAISAYHRLLDLKDKFCDVEVNHVISLCNQGDVIMMEGFTTSGEKQLP